MRVETRVEIDDHEFIVTLEADRGTDLNAMIKLSANTAVMLHDASF